MSEDNIPTRRSFLKHFTILLSAVTALMAAWGIGRFVSFNSSGTRSREASTDILNKLQPEVPLHVPEAGAWITKRQADESLLALDDRCTHLGCRQKWNPDRQLFECPCHGSEFDIEGNVKRGPANRALPRLYVTTGKDEKLHLSEKPPQGTPSS
ncbi:MAG: ubiquinol-cytochrome c reductase iron-sulfur subunit [Desulfomonile tiedjei]|nr:ubiquinol-cytochrome c reductase iron-sulfur subunit [Desulfomonile tiedjei]